MTKQPTPAEIRRTLAFAKSSLALRTKTGPEWNAYVLGQLRRFWVEAKAAQLIPPDAQLPTAVNLTR